jgi:hypothetical protein
MLLTSLLALLVSFLFFAKWISLRWPESTPAQRHICLAVFGLWPVGVFFRMPYAESLFWCGTLAVLYGMARRWPLVVLAIMTGFVTAVRPVGVALTLAFLWHVLGETDGGVWKKARRAALFTPVAAWGLLAYMAYQWSAFGTPFAFAQTQENYLFLAPQERHWADKLRSLATFEPIWGVYCPGNPRYWGNVGPRGNLLISIIFWNPILFVFAGLIVAIGALKRWLTGSEVILGVCLLAIPYATRSYEMSMASHGRFAAAVVVNYLVLGRILATAPRAVMVGTILISASLLGYLTFLYAAGYQVF